jgi:thiol-disulfide isomerase/thioredoxin
VSFFSNLRSAGALPVEGHLPGFERATGWLNSPPLGAAELHGKVVLVDFWTYTCINWLRTLAYVRAWAEKYQDQGLVVVGVHTPEFPFERDVDNVGQAVKDMAVEYPVALDSDYGIWQAFANRFWPAIYIADAEGRIRHHQFGEGGYPECEMHPTAAGRGRTRHRIPRPGVDHSRRSRGSGRLGEPEVSRDLSRLRTSTRIRLTR